MNKEKMKEEAIKRMKVLSLHPNSIKEFEETELINVSEHLGILYWISDELKEIVNKFEKENECMVYHIIHQYTNIGEMYTFLYVSSYEEEWEMDMEDLKEDRQLVCPTPIAYVYNATDPFLSEFGSVAIRPCNGGLQRIF